MDPATIWQSAIDVLPLLTLRAVALVLLGLSLVLAAAAVGALACQRSKDA